MDAGLATLAEVLAGVSTTLAAHVHAQDDGRVDDRLALYTSDAVLEVPGVGLTSGTDELRKLFVAGTPTAPQRHLVLNTVVSGWDAEEASAQSDVVYLAKGDAGWAIQFAARYYDEFARQGESWLLRRRRMEFAA